jgi:hypothetical protein
MTQVQKIKRLLIICYFYIVVLRLKNLLLYCNFQIEIIVPSRKVKRLLLIGYWDLRFTRPVK